MTAASPTPNPFSNPSVEAQGSLSLRLRILFVALLPMLVAVGLFAAYFAHRTINDAETSLVTLGSEAARRLAESVAFDLYTGNLPRVKQLMDVERASLGANTVAIYRNGEWVMLSGARGPLPEDPGRQSHIRIGPLHQFSHMVAMSTHDEPDPYLAPAIENPTQKAFVVVSLDREPIELARSQVGLAAASMAIVSISIALVLAWRLSGTVSKPLHDIGEAVDKLAKGDLTQRVLAVSPGELGLLQQGINQMAQRLEEHQRMLEQRIHEATSELRTQKTEAESATVAKSRFLAAASHDLRQPLHALSLLVEALEQRVPEGESRRLAEHIAASAHAMEKLLNALLDLSRLDAGVVKARPECFPLNRVLEGIAAQFGPVADMAGLRLSIRPTGMWIYSDPALLERILANLVGNALRYTDSGGVVVGARRVQGDWVRLEVWDSGKGIAEDFQARIFEEYFQLANPERHRDKGLGLGLAIVTRLARLLGSQVQVRSRVDYGSCFSVRFARCTPMSKAATPVAAPRLELPLQNVLVAFIDDDLSILEAMVEVFEHWGIALAAGESGEQVLQELLELGRAPDVILSDYRLAGGHTGIEAIHILRQAFGPIPAALITGDTATDTIQDIRASGLPLLHKPLKPAKLRSFLSHLMAEGSASNNP